MRQQILLAALLTGLLIDVAAASEPEPCNCPPPGAMPFGPRTFDRRLPDGDHFRPRPPLAEFDLDGDGRVSRAEVDRALRARFDESDTDHDGVLDEREFVRAAPRLSDGHEMDGPMSMPLPPPPPAAGDDDEPRLPPPGIHRRQEAPPHPARMFKSRDWNLDGELSFEEFAAPVRQIALRLDRNGDGVIDAREMRRPFFYFAVGPGFGPPPFPPPPREQESP